MAEYFDEQQHRWGLWICQRRKQALLVYVTLAAYLPSQLVSQWMATALSLNTGQISQIVVPLSHLHTKSWDNRAQVEQCRRYPLKPELNSNSCNLPGCHGQPFWEIREKTFKENNKISTRTWQVWLNAYPFPLKMSVGNRILSRTSEICLISFI